MGLSGLGLLCMYADKSVDLGQKVWLSPTDRGGACNSHPYPENAYGTFFVPTDRERIAFGEHSPYAVGARHVPTDTGGAFWVGAVAYVC